MDTLDSNSVSNQTKRLSVAAAALGEVGLSDSLKYWREVAPRNWDERQLQTYAETKSWCGGFALWCLKQAGLAPETFWKDRLGFLMVSPYVLRIVNAPETGDIAYFRKNQHHAVVCHAENGSVRLVNGNGEGGKVTVTDVPLDNVSAFYSIDRYL